MRNIWKRAITFVLIVVILVCCLGACGNNEPAETTVPVVTQSPEEAKVLKVLTLGHSLAVDCGHLLALIAKAQGYESLVVGTLYHSGCTLKQHVGFMTENSREYSLYISSTETAETAPQVTQSVTMKEAVAHDMWDIVIMQGGVFEVAKTATYTNGNIQTIQNFVKENAKNPNVTFGWHMAWVPPVDDELRNTFSNPSNPYVYSYEEYNHNRTAMYNAVTKCVGENILTDDSFVCLIPSGTAIENALSSYLIEKDLHRDYTHASDLTRVIASYVWYCVLTGVDQLDEISLDKVPTNLLVNRLKHPQGWELTDSEKALILEAVNAALKQPLQMTQSQYTEAPADYVPSELIKK